MKRLLFLALLFSILACGISAETDGPATLPTLFATTFPDTTGYTQATVCASACTYSSVASALASATCGTVIKVTAGQSFQGVVNATRTCTPTTWIVVLSSDCTFAGVCTHIGTQGHRIAANPAGIASISASMATISGPNTNDTATLNVSVSGGGAAYYWFGPGLIITGPANGTASSSFGTILDDTSGSTSPTNLTHIVYDRDYINCAAGQDCTRQFYFLGQYEAVVDSVCSGAHYVGNQSQCVWFANGYGPYKAVNDYLGAASQPVFSGGSGCPASSSVLPSDYEISGNFMAYDFGSRSASFTGGTAGNIHGLELKQGRRILLQGNVFDASAIAGGNYGAVNDWQPWLDPDGSCLWVVTTNVTSRFNEFLHAGSALQFAGSNGGGGAGAAYANLIEHDNLFDDTNQTNGTAENEWAYQAESNGATATTNLIINHNTVISSDSGGYGCANFDSNSGAGDFDPLFILTNNICFEGMYGIGANIAGGFTQGTAGLNMLLAGGSSAYTISNNVSVGAAQTTWPSGNFHPANAAAVGFTNFNSGNGGNYQLTSGSAYHNAATDGLDIGVSNFSCLNSLIAAATNGTYTESSGACAAAPQVQGFSRGRLP